MGPISTGPIAAGRCGKGRMTCPYWKPNSDSSVVLPVASIQHVASVLALYSGVSVFDSAPRDQLS
jgi:hypothetical protein